VLIPPGIRPCTESREGTTNSKKSGSLEFAPSPFLSPPSANTWTSRGSEGLALHLHLHLLHLISRSFFLPLPSVRSASSGTFQSNFSSQSTRMYSASRRASSNPSASGFMRHSAGLMRPSTSSASTLCLNRAPSAMINLPLLSRFSTDADASAPQVTAHSRHPPSTPSTRNFDFDIFAIFMALLCVRRDIMNW